MDFYDGQIFVGEYPQESAEWCNSGQQYHIIEISTSSDGMRMYKISANNIKEHGNMITDYISTSVLKPVIYSQDEVCLYKDITEVKSLQNDDVVAYHALRQIIMQCFSSENEVMQNFDLIWDAYGVYDYQGNIITDSLDVVKEYWQNRNLKNFETFLRDNPLLYTDGNYYGVEETDRNEMAQQFLSYQMKQTAGLNPTTIEWHTKKKACKEMPVEEFMALASAIEQYTLPFYNTMQSRKEQIFDATDKGSVFATEITYDNLA